MKHLSKSFFSLFALLVLLPATAMAHASQQSLVLLLPTELYIRAGAITVVITIAIASLMSHGTLSRLFAPLTIAQMPKTHTVATSVLAFLVMLWLFWLGLFGPTDPLANLMSLGFWVVFWISFILICGFLGNLWAWANPWTGPFRLLSGPDPSAPFSLPLWLGHTPAILGFLAFSAFAISNPDAADPITLARMAALYWMFTFVMMMLFGAEDWISKGEFLTVFMRLVARLSPLKRSETLQIGMPGWRIAKASTPPLTLALFALLLLGTGTFDGLNETFFWLAQIGVNPLAFPGRSAIVPETIAGYIAVNLILIAAFYLCVRITARNRNVSALFRRQCLTILPIALAYHFGHFLPTFLVDSQYTLAALSDPYSTGADLLGLGQFYVTTGFFNTTRTVSMIFTAQVCAIVIGHVISILLSHRVAADFFPTRKQVLISQIPLSLFMVGYTILGLWLLATPKGA